MNIKLFQITGDPRLMFLGLEAMKKFAGVEEVDPSIYEKVYEGTVETEELEGVFRIFNGEYPADYTGRSMSVSDVVCITDGEKAGYYFCDSIGFEKIKFDESKTAPKAETMMKVVVCRPDREAEVVEIEHTLRNMQKLVSEGVDETGLIEPFYPFEEPVAIVCNEDGKFNGLQPCRAVFDTDGQLLDVIFGTFFICGAGKSDFIGLTDEQAEKYLEMFKAPERIVNMNGRIIVLKM